MTPENGYRQARLQMVGSWEAPPSEERQKCSSHVTHVELSKERVWPEWRMGSGGTKGLRHLEVVIGSL